MHSFDIFDTLITRKTAIPTGIFAIMQDTLLKDLRYKSIDRYICEHFYDLRVHAEELARSQYQKNGCDEVTLEQIYAAMATTGVLCPKEIKAIVNLELETECKNIIGIEENILKLKNLFFSGEKVILISDMYIKSAEIRKILVNIDKIFEKIKIYVSADYKMGKHSGKLYWKIKEVENISFENWYHLGDNIQSDVKVPRNLGINAEYYPYEKLLPIEQMQIEKYFSDQYTQISIGTSRNLRISKKMAGVDAIGCSVGGNILCPYVQWILEEAKKKNIKRLYFIARDGYILKIIADILIKKWNLTIKTYYIYGSRKAWRMPAYNGEYIKLKQLIGWSYTEHIKSFSDLAKVLKISVEELIEFLPPMYKPESNSKEISFFELCFYVRYLDTNNNFKKFFIRKMKDEKALVIRYLKQEINICDPDFAFVDLGGGGFTQSCLAELLKTFCEFPVRTFFFKMDRINLMNNNICYNFMPSCLKNGLVIEMLCRASHGQTEGYIEKNSVIEPVLKENEGEQIIAHGYNEYMNGIRFFAEAYGDFIQEKTFSIHIDLLLQYMNFIMRSPDQQIYYFIANMPNSLTGREKKINTFAPKVTKKNLRDVFLFHPMEEIGKYYNGTDFDFALLYASKSQKKKIAFYQTKRNELLRRFNQIMHRSLIENNEHQLAYLESIPKNILGKKIVIYGAGKFGKQIYQFFTKIYDSTNIVWLDKEYKSLSKEGLSLNGDIDQIRSLEYDTIVIGVLNKKVFVEITNELIQRNVSVKKILWPTWEGVVDFQNEICKYLFV